MIAQIIDLFIMLYINRLTPYMTTISPNISLCSTFRDHDTFLQGTKLSSSFAGL